MKFILCRSFFVALCFTKFFHKVALGFGLKVSSLEILVAQCFTKFFHKVALGFGLKVSGFKFRVEGFEILHFAALRSE